MANSVIKNVTGTTAPTTTVPTAVKNNGATVVNQGNEIVYPEYTYENWLARQAWNKEIANNKQGYMAVDIMTMKDFYDAGGYAFIDDYRAELASVDAAYDRALPGYGVRGEQMASAGLTGSGYGDYLAGQAYAARVGGQALARQNAMANSNSFRSAYNQYVQQQLQKREENLQTVVDKAYAAGTTLDNFIDMATKLGIPQADAERGYDMLDALYRYGGVTGSGTKYPTYAGSTGTVTGGATTTTTTDSTASTEEWSIENLDTEDAAVAGDLARYLVAAVTGGTYTNADGEQVQMAATSIDAALAQLQGGYNDQGGAVTAAALKQVEKIITANVESSIAQGGYVSKATLDSLAVNGAFGTDGKESKVYKELLGEEQARFDSMLEAVDAAEESSAYWSFFGELNSDILTAAGVNADELTEENMEAAYVAVRKRLYEDGVISEEGYRKSQKQGYLNDFKLIRDDTDFKGFLNFLYGEKKELGSAYYDILDSLHIKAKTDINGIKQLVYTKEIGGGKGVLPTISGYKTQLKTDALKAIYQDIEEKNKNTAE